MRELSDTLMKVVRALPEFIVWKLDHFTTQLAARNAFQSDAHKAARARESQSFHRYMDKVR